MLLFLSEDLPTLVRMLFSVDTIALVSQINVFHKVIVREILTCSSVLQGLGVQSSSLQDTPSP